MKKILLIILCLYTINSFAQECGKTETGISTHPETPFNDDNCTLNNFDWRTATYNAPYYMGTATTNGQITSPFYNSDNTAIPELWNTFDYDAHDMLPEDGWELIINGITQAAPIQVIIVGKLHFWFCTISLRLHYGYWQHIIVLVQMIIWLFT
jgi:hypothetical protein